MFHVKRLKHLFLTFSVILFANEKPFTIKIDNKTYTYKKIIATEMFENKKTTKEIIVCCNTQFSNIEELKEAIKNRSIKPLKFSKPIFNYQYTTMKETNEYLNIQNCKDFKKLDPYQRGEAIITFLINEKYNKADMLLNCNFKITTHSLAEPYMAIFQGDYKKIDNLLKKNNIKISDFATCKIAARKRWDLFEYFTSKETFLKRNLMCTSGIDNVIKHYGYTPLHKKDLKKLSSKELRVLEKYDKRDYIKALICMKDLYFYKGDRYHCKYALKYFPDNIKVLAANKKTDLIFSKIKNLKTPLFLSYLVNLYIIKNDKNNAKKVYKQLLKEIYKQESSLSARIIVSILGPFMGVNYPKSEYQLKQHVINLTLDRFQGVNFIEKFLKKFYSDYNVTLKKQVINEVNKEFLKE